MMNQMNTNEATVLGIGFGVQPSAPAKYTETRLGC